MVGEVKGRRQNSSVGKLLQIVATTGLPTLPQVCQHLASSGRRALFPDAPLMTY